MVNKIDQAKFKIVCSICMIMTCVWYLIYSLDKIIHSLFLLSIISFYKIVNIHKRVHTCIIHIITVLIK